LSVTVSESALSQLISRFGTIETISVVCKQDYAFAFVGMSTQAEADAVIEGMNGRPFPTIGLGEHNSIRVAFQRGVNADDKGKREKARDRGHSAGRDSQAGPPAPKRPRNDPMDLLASRPGALDGMTMEPPTADSIAVVGSRFTVGTRGNKAAAVADDSAGIAARVAEYDRQRERERGERPPAPPSETDSLDGQSGGKNASLYVTNFPMPMTGM